MEAKLKKLFTSPEKILVIFSILSVMLLIGNAFTYSAKSEIGKAISLNNNWNVSYNNTPLSEPITLPYGVQNQLGDVFEFSTTLPEKLYEVEALALTVYQKSVWIYVDNQLIYEYEFSPKFLTPTPPGSGNITITLPENSSGKELYIKYRTETSSGNGFIMPPKIVNGAITQTVFTGNNVIIFACMVSFLFVALLLFVMYIIKFHSVGNNISNLSLSLIFASMAIWVLSYNRLTDVLTNNWVLVHELEYLSLYIIPFAVWNYLYCSWNTNSKLVKIMRNSMGLFVVMALAFKLFLSIDYSVILTFFHILVLINITLLIKELSTGFKSRQLSYKMFAIGIFIILLASILGLFQQYFLKGQLYLSVIFTSLTTVAGVLMVISIFCLENENLSDKLSNAFMQNLIYEHTRYEAILSNTGDVFFDWDTKNDTAYVSTNFEKYFGISPKTTNFGKFLTTGIKGISLPNNFNKIIKSLKSDISNQHIKCSFCDANNNIKWFSMDLTTNLDHMGEQTHIIGIIQDITEQKQLENEYNAQIQYNHIAKKMYDNVLEADLSENILLGDSVKSLCEALGIPHTSTFDETIYAIKSQLTHPDYADEYAEALSSERMLSLFQNGITSFEYETYELDSNGTYQWLHLDVQIYKSELTNTVRIISYVNNISQEKQRELSLMEASLKDPLTGILNKGALRVSSERFIENANPENTYALFMIDIDYFKQINDNFGHITGDAAITHVANIISSHFRDTDLIGRFGGDEFIVLLTTPVTLNAVEKKCEELNKNIKEPFKFKDYTLNLSLSIGVSFFPKDGIDYKTLCENADIALYSSKAKGRDTYTIFTPTI